MAGEGEANARPKMPVAETLLPVPENLQKCHNNLRSALQENAGRLRIACLGRENKSQGLALGLHEVIRSAVLSSLSYMCLHTALGFRVCMHALLCCHLHLPVATVPTYQQPATLSRAGGEGLAALQYEGSMQVCGSQAKPAL